MPHIYGLLKSQAGLNEVRVPINAPDPRITSPIFLSPDALTNPDVLMILIIGSGAVRAGMWARALCINNDLKLGTQLPYLEEAKKRNWGSIVLNPNETKAVVYKEHKDTPTPPASSSSSTAAPAPTPEEVQKAKEYYLNSDKKCQTFRGEVEGVYPIPGSESPDRHAIYVYDNFISKAEAKQIVIVAHSAGGFSTMQLLRHRPEIRKKITSIAFTDSVHSVSRSETQPVLSLLRATAVNYVRSNKPLDTRLGRSEGCLCVSAGHERHEFTSGTAISSVFRKFDNDLTNSN